MFVTKDAGTDWTRAEPNVPCLEMSAMLALPGKLLVGTRPAALYLSQGSGWEEIKAYARKPSAAGPPPTPIWRRAPACRSREKKPYGRLYAGIEVGGILVSDDEGQSWTKCNDGLTDADIHQILPAKQKPGLVVAACGEGVSRSTDRGSHWGKGNARRRPYLRQCTGRRRSRQHLSRHYPGPAAHLDSRRTSQDRDLQNSRWRELGIADGKDDRRSHAGNLRRGGRQWRADRDRRR